MEKLVTCINNVSEKTGKAFNLALNTDYIVSSETETFYIINNKKYAKKYFVEKKTEYPKSKLKVFAIHRDPKKGPKIYKIT